MESLSSRQRDILLDSLTHVKESIQTLIDWNKGVVDVNELPKSTQGMQLLTADCMLIQAICEGIKQIDNRTNGELLPLRPDIPWKQVKGMRDHIAHRYFEIDVDAIWFVITNELQPLLNAIDFFILHISNIKIKE